MTGSEMRRLLEKMGLGPTQRYEVTSLVERWSSRPDEEVHAAAHAFATRCPSAAVGGAALLLAQALLQERVMGSMTASERSDYEARLYDTHASGPDDAEVEAALADAAAHEEAGRGGHARQIRETVERHLAARAAEE